VRVRGVNLVLKSGGRGSGFENWRVVVGPKSSINGGT